MLTDEILTEPVHVLVGTYDLLTLCDLNAQLCRRSPGPSPLQELPADAELRFLLGDTSSCDPDLEHLWESPERVLVTTQSGRYPHTDLDVEVPFKSS